MGAAWLRSGICSPVPFTRFRLDSASDWAMRESGLKGADTRRPQLSAAEREIVMISRFFLSGRPRASRPLDANSTLRHQLPIQLTGDAQRLTQLSWTRTEIPVGHASAAFAHGVEPCEWLQSAQEDRARQSRFLAHQVRTPVHAIAEIDVPQPRGAEQRLIAGVSTVQVSM